MPDDIQAASSAAPPAPELTADALLSQASPAQMNAWRLSGNPEDLQAPSEDAPAPSTDTPADQPADAAPAPPAPPAASTDATPPPASEPGRPQKGIKARSAEVQADIDRLQGQLRQRAALREQLAREEQPPPPRQAARRDAPERRDPSDDPQPDPNDAEAYPDGIYDRQWMEDNARWVTRAHLRDLAQQHSEHQAVARLQAAEHELNAQWREKVDKAKAKYPDFEERALLAPTDIVKDSPIDRWVLESPNGAEVLYHLQTTPGEVRRLAAMPLVQQLRELARIELRFDTPGSPPPVSTAPAPGRTLGGQQPAGGDAVERALAAGDTEAYLREANARDLAAFRAGRR